MARIFLSYARADEASAKSLARVLEQAGHEVWWDRHIDGGSEFASEIEQALERAEVVLVAWSEHAAKSPWVRDEAGIGRDSGRLLPVALDHSLPPLGFRQFQALGLAKWTARKNDRRTAELLRAVERRAKGKDPVLRSSANPSGMQGWWQRKHTIMVIAAALLLLIAAGGALWIVRSKSANAEPASIAVLPFKNLSNSDRYFAEGVAEEILNQLAREPQFKVAGRTSSALFSDAADLRDVGRRLHVAYVLEGSVRTAGKGVRVDVSLVNTSKGMRLWSQNFQGNLDDIFAIQDRIGEQVALHVKRQLIHRAAARGTTPPRGDVYSLFLTARGLIRDREPAKLNVAETLLKQAIQRDPNYGRAWAWLAMAESSAWEFADFKQSQRDIMAHAQRAVKLAPDAADSHLAMAAALRMFDSNVLPQIQAELERASQLDPSSAEIWNQLGKTYEETGDFEKALDAFRRADAIDPLWFETFWQTAELSWQMGNHAESDAISRRVIRDSRADPFLTEMVRADMAFRRGDLSEAWKHNRAAGKVADEGRRIFVRLIRAELLRSLGYFDQAARESVGKPVSETMRRMWAGEPPPSQQVLEYDPIQFWGASLKRSFVLRTLVRARRYAEVVRLFDRRFQSPDEMVRGWPGSNEGLIDDAPMVAIALQETGRGAEAQKLLALVDSKARNTVSRGPVTNRYSLEVAKLFAVEGKRDEALRTLQKAVNSGWFYQQEGDSFLDISQEPAFRSLDSDPRFQRIRLYFTNHVARERLEVGSIDA